MTDQRFVLHLLFLCWRLLNQTLMREGIKGLYKGMAAPLATVALFNAVLFASRGQMAVLLAHKDCKPLGNTLVYCTAKAAAGWLSHTQQCQLSNVYSCTVLCAEAKRLTALAHSASLCSCHRPTSQHPTHPVR